MTKWLNNKIRIHKADEITKPCKWLEFCPYGALVEEFPITENRTKYSCKVFGHDCPVFYMAEGMSE